MEDYIFSNEFSKNLDAMIYTCGYETCAPGHSYGPAVRSGYLIHYIISGKGIYKTDGQVFRLQEGDAFLIRPGVLIYYEADRQHPWTYTWMGFQGIKMEEYFSRTSLLENPVFHYEKDDRVRLCHDKMFEAYHLKSNRDLMINSILYEYLYLLASKFPRNTLSPREKHISYVEDALRYIENNFDHNISIHELADYLHIERSYLYRLFKSFTGTSLQEYLLDFRMRRACSLLKETDFSIGDIARSVGYTDALYFSRIFRQKKGMTPTQFRKSQTI